MAGAGFAIAGAGFAIAGVGFANAAFTAAAGLATACRVAIGAAMTGAGRGFAGGAGAGSGTSSQPSSTSEEGRAGGTMGAIRASSLRNGPAGKYPASDSELEALVDALGALERALDEGACAPVRRPSTELAELSLDLRRDTPAVVRALVEALTASETRTGHRRYFGLPNPSPTREATLGAALAGALSAQLATRSAAPLAIAIERRLVRELGARFGLPDGGGTLTAGGAEASTMAVHAALVRHDPLFPRRGARGLARSPVVYVSAEGHPTIAKAVRMAGLGDDALRRVRVDASLRMRPDALREAIANDRLAGRAPVLVVATAGTTATGAIDDLEALATIAERESAWLHVDAAWGGLLAIAPQRRHHLAGIARASSIAFDPHKALFVPTGAGAFLTRERDATGGLYAIESAYLPRDRRGEPHATTPQWSRAFVGLPAFLSLAVGGFAELETRIERQLELATRLTEGLAASGFRLTSESPLPVACFVDGRSPEGASARHLTKLARAALRDAGAYLAVVRLPGGARVLRAAIVSHRTGEGDVDALVSALASAR